MNQLVIVMNEMIGYFGSDVRRINHFLKVYRFAKTIGAGEGLQGKEQKILEIAALTHDIGIKNSLRKYGSAAGHYQETEGPPEAEKLLKKLKIEMPVIERVSWLIARHHTYDRIDGNDYQILVEADFLVNAYEDALSPDAIAAFGKKVFRTKTGIRLLEILYGCKI